MRERRRFRILRDERDRRINRLAFAALGTLVVEPIYVLVDTAIVGRLGTDTLAALGVAGVVILSVVAFISFVEYITSDIAFAHGRDREDLAKQSATNALWLGVGLGVLGGLVMALGAPIWCRLLGAKGDVYDGAVTYVRIFSVALPFSQINFVGHGVMRGVNRLRQPMIIVIVANIVNVILEVIAVYGLGLGIAGSAWSTVIVIIGSAIWFLIVLRPHTRPAWPEWAPIAVQLRSGMHLTIRVVGMLLIWVVTTRIAARIDAQGLSAADVAAGKESATLAAHNIVNQLFMFLALGIDSYAIPAQSFVAGALGEGRIDEAVSVGNACTRLSLWAGGAVAAVLLSTCWLVPRLFSTDPDVISQATVGLVILAVMQIPGAIAFALDGALIGAKDEKFLGRQSWRNLFGFAPLAIATWLWPSFGIVGLWGAQLAWIVTRAYANDRRFRSLLWTRHADAVPTA